VCFPALSTCPPAHKVLVSGHVLRKEILGLEKLNVDPDGDNDLIVDSLSLLQRLHQHWEQTEGVTVELGAVSTTVE
jgi:hypothetical protein